MEKVPKTSNRSRRNRNRRRVGGNRSGSGVHIGDEFLTFSVALGATQNITLGNISTRPSGCNFRPLFMNVQLVTAYVPAPASDSFQGFFCPAAVDCRLLDSSGRTVATSMPQALGTNPRRVWVRYPVSGDWFSYIAASSSIIGQISAVCLGNPGNTVVGYLRGIVRLRYQFSFEVLTATCPTHLCDSDPASAPDGGFLAV